MNKLVVIATILLLAGCSNKDAQKQAADTQALLTDTTVPVQVIRATTADLSETLDVTGVFVASEESSIGAAVPGRLVSVYVRDGDAVTAGQAIAQQETSDLATRLRQARAQAQQASASLQQAQTDARIGPTKSESSVKSAEARLAQAKSRYEKAKNGARTEERSQAEWAVKRAKSDMDTTKAALNRAIRLYEEGAIAKVEVENADNRYQNALAAYENALQTQSMVQDATRPEDLQTAALEIKAAEESLRAARADKRLDVLYQQRVDGARAALQSANEQVSLAHKALSDATIRSPFSGRISGKPLQAGSFVSPGLAIAKVVGVQGTYFEANVPESKIAQIEPGALVDVTVDALKSVRLTGTVLAVNPVASGQGRLYSVLVTVAERTGVKPGMFARGRVHVGRRSNATVVPNEAVLRDGEASAVFVIDGDRARKVSVKTGLRNGNQIEVFGIEKGDSVVVSGQSGLVDGSRVKIEKPGAGKAE